MRVVAKCLLVLVLSYGVTLTVAPTIVHAGGVQASSAVQSSLGVAKGGWLKRTVVSAATTAALLAAMSSSSNAQRLLEADEIQWAEVESTHHRAVLALQSMPTEEGETPKLYTGVYVGDTDHGDAIVAGLKINSADPEVDYAVYSADGLLADNVRIEEIAFFNIGVEGFSETALLMLDGVQLDDSYEPVRMDEFPLDDVGGGLTMVTYWRGADEEELPVPTARLRSCEIGDGVGGWRNFGVGLTTCSPAAAFRSVFFYDKRSVGFHGGQSRDLIFAEGISDGLLNYLDSLQGRSVEVHGKLPVTWGQLKRQ